MLLEFDKAVDQPVIPSLLVQLPRLSRAPVTIPE